MERTEHCKVLGQEGMSYEKVPRQEKLQCVSGTRKGQCDQIVLCREGSAQDNLSWKLGGSRILWDILCYGKDLEFFS